MVTIKDIAEKAGVSLATVSRVVNGGPKVGDATRAKVKKVMVDLGYRPNVNARALASQTNTSLGVVIADLKDPFFASLAHGVDSVAREQNKQILLSSGLPTKDTELRAINTLLEHRCDAMVVHSKALDDSTLLTFAEQIPGMILINRYIPEIAHRCVWLDNIEGGKMMAKHLLDHGHKHIALINSHYDIDDPQDRAEGIKTALAAVNIELPADAIELNTPDQEGGERAIRHLLSKGIPFSAVLAYNDAMAAGAISMLSDHGLEVPNDVSIVGFDDVLLSRYCRPKLTTLHYPIEQMGVKAAHLALHYAKSEANKVQGTFKYTPTLVSRASVAKLLN